MAIIKPNNNTISAITALPAAITTGRVLQVVNNTQTSRFTTSSTSLVAATGYTIAITPSATSSKVFVCISAMCDTGATDRVNYMTIYRDSTNLGEGNDGLASSHSTGGRIYTPVTLSVLDSPSSTSSLTYQVYMRAYNGNVVFNDQESKAQLTAFEIAG
tara:strand:- start:136 stop:612 length:477 start_codon:yes stop_codon:yes gene_type:complete